MNPVPADLVEIVDRSTESLTTLSGKRLLVAGAGGFLASTLCHAIVRANHTVLASNPCTLIAVDNFVTGLPANLEGLTTHRHFSALNRSVTQLERLDADFVFHAASIASPAVYRRRPLETMEVNSLGTWRLLDLARAEGVESFLYLSSSEVYGDPEPSAIPTDEDYVGRVSFTGPRACYDESKRFAETLCRTFFEQHRVPVKVARPFNVYGPMLRLDDGRMIPDLMRSVVERKPVVLHSDGKPTRSFCYVTDATTAFLALLVSPHDGEAFNVGTTEEVTMLEVATRVSALADLGPVTFAAAEDDRYLVDNPQRRCPNIAKIATTIGWAPTVALDEGLRRTLATFRAFT